MTDQQHDDSADDLYDDVDADEAEELLNTELPKKDPETAAWVPREPALDQVRRKRVIAGAIGGLVLLVGGAVGVKAAWNAAHPVEQERPIKLGKPSTERGKSEVELAMEAAAKKKAQTPTFTGTLTPQSDEPVDPAWLTAKAHDPRTQNCQELEDPNDVVKCEEAKENLNPLHQNFRNVNRGGYAAAYRADNGGKAPGPDADQENEAKYTEPLQTLGILDSRQGGGVSVPSQGGGVSPVAGGPVVGLSAADAHRMAEQMAGGDRDGDPEASKERFMAQGGVQTIGGDTVDVGECDMDAATPVHGSVLMATNSDLPTQNTITIVVNQTVWCGDKIALPQGSKFVASLDQRVGYGQERQMLCARQLTRPKSAAHPRGDRKQLGCFPIADIQGRTGMPASVDNHWGAVITGSLLSALLGMGPSALAGNQQGFAPSVLQGGAQQFGNAMNQAGQRVVNRELQRKPTLTTEMLEDVVVLFSSNLQLDPWEPSGAPRKARRVAAW